MRSLHLDCPSGIAGDMLLAALIDLGASLDYIRAGLNSLNLDEPWTLSVVPTRKNGIAALMAEVRVGGVLADAEPREHDSDRAHRHDHPHHRHDDHDSDHTHDHDHGHGHHHGHRHTHRPYRVIRDLIAASPLPKRVRERAGRVFWELAAAEGAVHGIDPDEVHFHEVGSTDAIIDVVGCCLALEALEIDVVTASPLHVGRGFVRAAHGRIPVPAPATLKLLEGLDAYQTDITGELVTPTGAALVRGLCERVGPMTPRRIERVGHGAGRRDLPIPNILRALLSVSTPSAAATSTAGSAPAEAAAMSGEWPWERDEVVEIEANIDDMAPELFGYLFDKLLRVGARDAWVVPATMKKSRPAHVLHVLADPGDEAKLTGLLFAETTTLGVRVTRQYRSKLYRRWVDVDVGGRTVRVKIGSDKDRILNVSPEYDDCAEAAAALGRPLKEVVEEARERARRRLHSE